MSTVGQVSPGGRAAAAPNTRPHGAPGAPKRPPLHVVPPVRVKLRGRRRRARVLMVTIGLSIALGMFAIVGAQVVLTQRQLRLDAMGQALSQAQTTNDQLQLQVATLKSPSRIVSEAETKLHMTVPTSVVYLTPGAKPGTTRTTGAPAGDRQGGASSGAVSTSVSATPSTTAAPAILPAPSGSVPG